MTAALPSPRKAQRITTRTVISPPHTDASPLHGSCPLVDCDPIIPPINAYGTFDPQKLSSKSGISPSSTHRLLRHSPSHASHLSSISGQSQHQPLLPSSQPPPNESVMDQVSGDLIPFAGTISMLRRQFAPPPLEVLPPGVSVSLLEIRNHNLNNRQSGPSNRRSKPDMTVLTHNPISVDGEDLCTKADIRSIAQRLRAAAKTFLSRLLDA